MVRYVCDICRADTPFALEMSARGYMWAGPHALCHSHTTSLLKYITENIEPKQGIELVEKWRHEKPYAPGEDLGSFLKRKMEEKL